MTSKLMGTVICKDASALRTHSAPIPSFRELSCGINHMGALNSSNPTSFVDEIIHHTSVKEDINSVPSSSSERCVSDSLSRCTKPRHSVRNRSSSCSSSSSISCSSQSSNLDASFNLSQRCRTPSTIAYTHSSAMEDTEDEELHESPSAKNQSRSGSQSSLSNTSPTPECSSPSEIKHCGSLSSLSSYDDDTVYSSDHEPDQSNSVSVSLNNFTSRLSRILRRVEELDLLKLAVSVGNKVRTTNGTTFASGNKIEGDELDEMDNQDSPSLAFPESARLTHQEIVTLCTESARVRASGSMSTIPTGRLVRFLTLLSVNMKEAAHITGPFPTKVRLTFSSNLFDAKYHTHCIFRFCVRMYLP